MQLIDPTRFRANAAPLVDALVKTGVSYILYNMRLQKLTGGKEYVMDKATLRSLALLKERLARGESPGPDIVEEIIDSLA